MVAVSDGNDSALHDLSIEWVHVDLVVLSSVDVDSGSSSGDVGWEADVVEDLVMDVGQGS